MHTRWSLLGAGARLVACAVMLVVFCRGAIAHPGVSTVALVKVSAEGRVEITVRADVLALAVGHTSRFDPDEPMLALLHGPEDELDAAMVGAREALERGLVVRVDDGGGGGDKGTDLAFGIVAWARGEDVRAARGVDGGAPRLPLKMDYVVEAQARGPVRRVAVGFPIEMGDVVVTVDRPTLEPVALPLGAGEVSPWIEVGPGGAAAVSEKPAENAAEKAGAGKAVDAPATVHPFWRFLKMGFVHIIPLGLDHILFVLGLFLLSTSTRGLLLQVTAFTVAHSVTLALTMLGKIDLAAAVVEPVIAASIVLVAVENIVVKRVHPWRVAVVFVFGLVHGMGFAGVLREAALPRGQLVGALIAFNVGVELGQLAVIGAALLVVGWWRQKPWYRARVVVPASALIALVGAWWVVERVWG